MPARPMKPCKHRGCGALVADGKSHCDQHAHEAVKWKPDAVRGNRHARGYGSAWERSDCAYCVATAVAHRSGLRLLRAEIADAGTVSSRTIRRRVPDAPPPGWLISRDRRGLADSVRRCPSLDSHQRC